MGKFLKKLWCCVSGRVQQGNLVLSTELVIYICTSVTIESFKADILSISPRQSNNDEALTDVWLVLEMSTLKLLIAANLCYQLS